MNAVASNRLAMVDGVFPPLGVGSKRCQYLLSKFNLQIGAFKRVLLPVRVDLLKIVQNIPY